MSLLRPECHTTYTGNAIPRETALFLIQSALNHCKGLIHGKLHGPFGGHCAMGAFWHDNPKLIVSTSLVDEVAAVNDSLGPCATPRQRWLTVRSWLRLKLRILANSK